MAVFGQSERLEDMSKALNTHISHLHILQGLGIILLLFQLVCNFFLKLTSNCKDGTH